MADTDRCVHGRYRIDPCIGCGRRYVDGELTGPLLTSAPGRSPHRHVAPLALLGVALWGGGILLHAFGGEPDSPLPGIFGVIGIVSLVAAIVLHFWTRDTR